MSIEEYFGDWSKVLDLEETNKIVHKVKNIPICPVLSDIFRAFKLCRYNDLRVVVIGQDPYSNLRNKVPVATGLAFANTVDTPLHSFSPSLDILRDSVMSFSNSDETTNFDPSLEKWASQGVLLLNSALTCQVGKTGSHMLLWRPFMKSLLINLSERLTGIVYVLMGSNAQSLEVFINSKTNHIIKTRHPSYYARTGTSMPSDIWRKINKILIGINGYGIKWYESKNIND